VVSSNHPTIPRLVQFWTLFLLLSSMAFGQYSRSSLQKQAGAPAGTCPGTNVFDLNISNGNLYTCPVAGGPWVLLGGSGSGTIFYGTDSGTVNAYVVTNSSVTALTPGTIGCFKAANANTSTTPTVNFNGLGNVTITKMGGITLGGSGDIGTTEPSCVIFDGTTFQLLDPQQVTGSGAMVLASSPSFANRVQLNGATWESATAPTVASGFGATSPSISISNGTAAFTINVGTGTITNPGVLTFPAAPHHWNVQCTDTTTISTTNFVTLCKGTSTTSVTCTDYTDTATSTGAAWTASDTLDCTATAE